MCLDVRELRALVIEIVLATDMSFHFQQVKNMKNLLSTPEKCVVCASLLTTYPCKLLTVKTDSECSFVAYSGCLPSLQQKPSSGIGFHNTPTTTTTTAAATTRTYLFLTTQFCRSDVHVTCNMSSPKHGNFVAQPTVSSIKICLEKM